MSEPFLVNWTSALPDSIVILSAVNLELFLTVEDVVPWTFCTVTAPVKPKVSAFPPGVIKFKYDCSAAVFNSISPLWAVSLELSTVILALFVKFWTRTEPPAPEPDSWFHLLNSDFAKLLISSIKPLKLTKSTVSWAETDTTESIITLPVLEVIDEFVILISELFSNCE